jgi:hypothetical protein
MVDDSHIGQTVYGVWPEAGIYRSGPLLEIVRPEPAWDDYYMEWFSGGAPFGRVWPQSDMRNFSMYLELLFPNEEEAKECIRESARYWIEHWTRILENPTDSTIRSK